MSKYIDFYLIGELVDSHGNVHYEDLKNLQTADVVERKRGEWVLNDDQVYECKDCGYVPSLDGYTYFNYCPNCGARMQSE